MSTNTLSATIDLTGTETLDTADFPAAGQTSDRTLRTGGLAVSCELSATTTPALQIQPVQISLTIGAAPTDIDLTVVDIGIGRDVSMSGKRLIAWMVSTSASNTGAISIAPKGTNGYNIWGAADGKYYFQPGETIGSVISGAAGARAQVGASTNYITVTGTQDDTCELLLWFGN